MRRKTQKVHPSDTRPKVKDNITCGYCDAKIGEEHKPGCVCRQRTVVLETTIRFVAHVVEDWDVKMVEFQYNDSSRCADNTIHDLSELLAKENEVQACTCAASKTKFIREATSEDELRRFPFLEEER